MSQQSGADIEFTQGEFGDNYDITILNPDGTPADLSPFPGGVNQLIIGPSDYRSPPKLVTNVTIVTVSSVARWVMASGQTNFFGSYIAVLFFANAGNTLVRKTKPMTVMIYPSPPLT